MPTVDRRVLLRGPRVPAVATSLLLLALAVAPRLAAARAGRRFIDVGLDRSPLPLEAIRFVGDNGLRERMYNDFEIGSYLAFEGYPRYRVFVELPGKKVVRWSAEDVVPADDPESVAEIERMGCRS